MAPAARFRDVCVLSVTGLRPDSMPHAEPAGRHDRAGRDARSAAGNKLLSTRAALTVLGASLNPDNVSRRSAMRPARAGDASGKEVTVNARSLIFALAAFSAAAPTPASAFEHLGSVYLDTRSASAPVLAEPFAGRLEYLGFHAPHGEIACESVRATFRDGSQHDVYRGGKISGGGATAELPQHAGAIERLEFRCHGTPSIAEIQILGEPGKYAAEWRQDPAWAKWAWRFPAQLRSVAVASD
jgi:hypothetical protein